MIAAPLTRRPAAILAALLATVSLPRFAAAEEASGPYPRSAVILGADWRWSTLRTAAPGSDLWPVAWGADGHLYTAWGDGGGFGGGDKDGRVALGFGRIEGGPEDFRGYNVHGGKNPEHPGAFPKLGKTSGLTSVDGTLYALVNLQNAPWPDVDHALYWSADQAATWAKADWVFSRGPGRFQPARFVSFGRDYAGVPDALAGFVYLVGYRQGGGAGAGRTLHLARVGRGRLRDRGAYEFYGGVDSTGTPRWAGEEERSVPFFADPRGVTSGAMVYLPALRRFLLTTFHTGPGQLGVFEAKNPWGPWSTVAYLEDWGGMAAAGEGLGCEFPAKWMSADGRTLWCVFSVYGGSAKQGIQGHDRFNLVQVGLELAK